VKKIFVLILSCGLIFGTMQQAKPLNYKFAIAGSVGASVVAGGGAWLLFDYLEKKEKIDLSSLSKKEKVLLKAVIILVAAGVGGGLGYWLLERLTPNGLLRRARSNLEKIGEECRELGDPMGAQTLQERAVFGSAYLSMQRRWRDAQSLVRAAQGEDSGVDAGSVCEELERMREVLDSYHDVGWEAIEELAGGNG